MRSIIIMVVGTVVVVSTLIVLYILTSVPSQDYSLDVDAMKDEQSLFVNSRIILTNTGRLPLTHILVDFGNKSESITEILPGQKFPVSPPEGTQLRTVTVTADHGINITKEYRRPIKLPGMMGS
jgi:hypothetical protein